MAVVHNRMKEVYDRGLFEKLDFNNILFCEDFQCVACVLKWLKNNTSSSMPDDSLKTAATGNILTANKSSALQFVSSSKQDVEEQL